MKRTNQTLLARVGTLTLALAMALSMLAGCGQQTPSSSVSSSGSSSQQETPQIPEKMEGDEFGNGAIGTHGGVSSGSV